MRILKLLALACLVNLFHSSLAYSDVGNCFVWRSGSSQLDDEAYHESAKAIRNAYGGSNNSADDIVFLLDITGSRSPGGSYCMQPIEVVMTEQWTLKGYKIESSDVDGIRNATAEIVDAFKAGTVYDLQPGERNAAISKPRTDDGARDKSLDRSGRVRRNHGPADSPIRDTDEERSDEKQDVRSLEQLLADVQKVVPEGWIVDIKLADPNMPSRRGSHPTLVIKSEKPLPVQYFHPGMPARSADEVAPPAEISQEVVAIRFVTLPYKPPQRYAMKRNRNDELRQTRIQFTRQYLREIPTAHKGPDPIPPHAFRPRTEEEAQSVRQYAILWISTQTTSLPTHHAEKFAFVMHRPSWLKIRDQKKAQEYEQILDAIEKIIIPYEK